MHSRCYHTVKKEEKELTAYGTVLTYCMYYVHTCTSTHVPRIYAKHYCT